MALLFYDGFDTYATADITKEWNSILGTVAISPTDGRRSGSCLMAPSVTNTIHGTVTRTFANRNSVVIGFAFKMSALPIDISLSPIMRLLDGSSAQNEVTVSKTTGTLSVTRNGTVIAGPSAASISAGDYNYIEYKTFIHDTTGSFELRLNGETILSGSNIDTKATANASVSAISFGFSNALAYHSKAVWSYDDIYILDATGATNNDFLGDVRIDALYPTADGNYTQWTTSTGVDHFALVDDPTPNTTDYVSDGTAGNKDSFVMADPPALASQVIYGVRVKVAAAKDDAGARSLKVGVRSGAVDSLSAAKALSTSQLYYSNIHEVDPATGLAWSPSAVNALEALIETA